MGYFFNGRLYTTPAVMSEVIDSGFYDQNSNVGNVLCLIGQSNAGPVQTPTPVSSPAQALAIFGSGDLAAAAKRAFNPSSDVPGPAEIVLIRINPSIAASGVISDASGNQLINLVAASPGTIGNQVSYQVSPGSLQGFKVSIALGNNYASQDNLFQGAFTITNTTSGSTATIDGTNLTLSTGAHVIPLSQFPNVQALVNYINTISGYAAVVSSGGAGLSPIVLDHITAQPITASYPVTATLNAIANWLTANGTYVVASQVPGSGTMPQTGLPSYLTGGVDGVATNTDWSTAFTNAQAVDVQWVVPLSGSASVIAMADAHVQFCSNNLGLERRSVCGTTTGTTNSAAATQAATLDSNRTSLVSIGMYDFNGLGVLTLYQPYILAAMIGGMAAGVTPGTPLTNKQVSVQGLERTVQIPIDTDYLISNGVMPVAKDGVLFRVIKSISTWLTDSKLDKIEVSVGAATDYTVRTVRQNLSVLKGQGGSPALLGQAVAITETTLRLLSNAPPTGPGILVGDASSPAYKNITASLNLDVLAVSFQCSPIVPVNFIPITVAISPYSGTASVVAAQ